MNIHLKRYFQSTPNEVICFQANTITLGINYSFFLLWLQLTSPANPGLYYLLIPGVLWLADQAINLVYHHPVKTNWSDLKFQVIKYLSILWFVSSIVFLLDDLDLAMGSDVLTLFPATVKKCISLSGVWGGILYIWSYGKISVCPPRTTWSFLINRPIKIVLFLTVLIYLQFAVSTLN